MSKVFKSKIIYILIFISMMFTLVNGDFAVEANSIEWMEYSAYINQESDIAWEHPELYVGCNATFDTITYSKFTVGNLVDGEIVPFGAASLQEGAVNLANIGLDYVVTITDYFFDDTANSLWYKVEPAEGYTLPQAFIDNPYVKYAANYDVNGWPPAAPLQMLPKKAIVRGETLTINDNTATASDHVELDKAIVPATFDVSFVQGGSGSYTWYGYDLGDISSWGLDISSEYRYVNEDQIILIPVAVTACYDKLLNADSTNEYNEILESIPQDILDMFTPSHNEGIEDKYDQLYEIENVEYSTTVMVNGISVPVSVKGKIPQEGVKLAVSTVDFETVVNEGFRVKEITDLIAALDIKILNTDDDSEWQPEEGDYIEVSIGISALGYEDGSIFKLKHKHGDIINEYDIFVVMDGKLTLYVDGFSLFTVEKENSYGNAQRLTDTTNLTLAVGESKVYFCTTGNNDTEIEEGWNGNIPGSPSKWAVTDTAGAIHYNVYTNGAPGNGGCAALWLKVVALRETEYDSANNIDTRVKITFQRNNNFYINASLSITTPKAVSNVKNGQKLYIKDTVNTTGNITAMLVDTDGDVIEKGLDGASFSWTRDDHAFISTRAYSSDFRSVNIAIDHSGLVEARKEDNEYKLVTYNLHVVLADGTEHDAAYTVYYQSEIINASFEFPNDTSSENFKFYVNGYPNLYWKTTAPGAYASGYNATNNLTKDIEVADMSRSNGTTFGITQAADAANGGTRFAELNAEAFGALYQDIITAPGEDIDWKFSHAPRKPWDGGGITTNAMFIVIGATEDAQRLATQGHLEALGARAKEVAGNNNQDFLDGKDSVTVSNFTYKGVNYGTYEVWYHNAGRSDTANYVWTALEGSYSVPEEVEGQPAQYRTRLFFVSEPNTINSSMINAGNLIDVAQAGQFKSYIIEYYEESYASDGTIQLNFLESYTQKGDALVYSFVDLVNIKTAESEKHDYLHRILINGENYPYEIRYKDENGVERECIYVEKYAGTATDPLNRPGNPYAGRDIVVQVYVRDTVIAIKKEIEFPSVVNGTEKKELLSVEQKLNLMNDLVTKYGGYEAKFNLSYKEEDNYVDFSNAAITIKSPGPDGSYSSYDAPHNNPSLGYNYYVEETQLTEMPGLKLSGVTFEVKGYRYGASGTNEFSQVFYYKSERPLDPEKDELMSPAIRINSITSGENAGYKVADVIVTNIYEEKQTKINYQAIGSGKLKHVPEDGDELTAPFVDKPTETLAFYSGKAIGCTAYPSSKAEFNGWYRLCTGTETPDLVKVINNETTLNLKRVTPADGVYNESAHNSFKPNANIINTDEITFYAVFETKSIKINKTNGEPNQTYIYHVKGDEFDIEVSLKCDANGNGFVEIYEVNADQVTVTEVTPWTWRDSEKKTQTKSFGTKMLLTFDFGREKDLIDYWLNGYYTALEPNIKKTSTLGGE